MEYSKALTFIWEDPRWQQKMLIGTGVVIASVVLSIVLVGVLGFLIIAGYSVRLLQNVRAGQPHPLPEWDEWGEDLARGFKLFVVGIVWALPVMILVIPSGIGSAMTGARSEGIQLLGVLLSITTGCLSVLYGLLLAAVSPGFSIAFAKDEQIMSGLQFRDIVAWTQDNIGQVVVVVLIVIVASIAISLLSSIVGVLLCVIGLIVTIPLGTLVTSLFQYHLYGQLAYAYPYGGGLGDSGVGTTPSAPAAVEMPPAVPVPPAAETTPDVEPGASSSVEETSAEDDAPDYPDSGIDEEPKS